MANRTYNKSSRRYRYIHRKAIRNRIIFASAAVLIAAIVLLIIFLPRNTEQKDDIVQTTVTPTEINETAEPDTPETEAPSEEDEKPQNLINGLLIPDRTDTSSVFKPKTASGYLPVYGKMTTGEKKLAITVDDLWQEKNVAELLDICDKTGAKLTFFPIGEAVLEDAALLKRIHESGHEIENHTYNHVNLYALSSEKMCEQLTKQNEVINKALGLDYKMHFLRPRGGNADYDLRMHKMLIQMDYVGISHWSISGTPDLKTWYSSISNGDVILFHATDADFNKLRKLIPKLVEDGYKLVTLNELYGLPDNEIYPLGTTIIGTTYGLDFQEMEADIPFTALKKGDVGFTVRRLQLRLTELGYYSIECDGDYGSGTVTAVTAFQKNAGLDADGIAGSATIEKLFSNDAPKAK